MLCLFGHQRMYVCMYVLCMHTCMHRAYADRKCMYWGDALSARVCVCVCERERERELSAYCICMYLYDMFI